MNSSDKTHPTQLVQRATSGDQPAAHELIDLVYDELRSMAVAQLRNETPGHTLQPTSLVHEAFLKLIDQNNVDWQGKTHFLAIGAQAMRRILVDHARRKNREKRGGGLRRVKFDEKLTLSREDQHDVLSVHEAINELHQLDSQQARILEMRFFGGMTSQEVADFLGMSKSTVDRQWRTARAWLRKHLSEADDQ